MVEHAFEAERKARARPIRVTLAQCNYFATWLNVQVEFVQAVARNRYSRVDLEILVSLEKQIKTDSFV